MNLKEGLRSITPEAVHTVINPHSAKFDSVPSPDDELEQQEQDYPGLAIISPMLFQALINSGHSEETAALMAAGASLAVNFLIEVAELDALPNID